MKQNQIKHLPILDEKGRPIGIVTQANMLGTAPSPVTTLNVFEIVSYLDSVTMESIMACPVLAVDESAALPTRPTSC